ncbi:MAG: hypothetical protein LBN93_09515 [Candidatus Symbiothrix sp.]|jgi:hypothetical protein|nr:hypothetical protein [Candidatus Symbiothrix sp.]
MYQFRNLKAEYSIATKITCPDGQTSAYNSRIALKASYQYKEGHFLFVLEKKTGTKLDDAEPQKPV